MWSSYRTSLFRFHFHLFFLLYTHTFWFLFSFLFLSFSRLRFLFFPLHLENFGSKCNFPGTSVAPRYPDFKRSITVKEPLLQIPSRKKRGIIVNGTCGKELSTEPLFYTLAECRFLLLSNTSSNFRLSIETHFSLLFSHFWIFFSLILHV